MKAAPKSHLNLKLMKTEMRLLKNRWIARNGWPHFLEVLEIEGLRGWTGFKIEFDFPIVAICGENGSGKSTIIQSAVAVYSAPSSAKKRRWFASDFFRDTPWDVIEKAAIKFRAKCGEKTISGSVRKPNDRWRGNPGRPKRNVEYIDLARIQPVSARTGYLKIAKSNVKENSARPMGSETISKLSEIMTRHYDSGREALTIVGGAKRPVAVVSIDGKETSAFHLGAGELTVTELLQNLESNVPKYSLIAIDELETSLHPRAQRKLIRNLAERCRVNEWQIILTTHSPYILGELPPEARGYIMTSDGKKSVVFGVSPEFAMTKMDDEPHPEADIYVEDDQAKIMLQEILVQFGKEYLDRIQITPFGAASVGQALGQMVVAKRFNRPTLVFLDGDQSATNGCFVLPGGDAPERVVFAGLKMGRWHLLDAKIARDFSDLADACDKAMTLTNHHEWPSSVASKMHMGNDVLWQNMCGQWAGNCLKRDDAERIIQPIRDLFA